LKDLRITTRQLFNPSIKVCSKVVSYIRNNSGDEDQAQDVVQEVLILLFNQAKAKNCSSPVRLMLTFLLCKENG
jgi:DNA-directed RNA polymerase specialized sigma24 family protein